MVSEIALSTEEKSSYKLSKYKLLHGIILTWPKFRLVVWIIQQPLLYIIKNVQFLESLFGRQVNMGQGQCGLGLASSQKSITSRSEDVALIDGRFLSSVLCGGVLSFLKDVVSRHLWFVIFLILAGYPQDSCCIWEEALTMPPAYNKALLRVCCWADLARIWVLKGCIVYSSGSFPTGTKFFSQM